MIDIDEDEITPDASISEDMDADSLDFVDIFARIRKTINVSSTLEQWVEEEKNNQSKKYTVKALSAFVIRNME